MYFNCLPTYPSHIYTKLKIVNKKDCCKQRICLTLTIILDTQTQEATANNVTKVQVPPMNKPVDVHEHGVQGHIENWPHGSDPEEAWMVADGQMHLGKEKIWEWHAYASLKINDS